MTGNKASKIFIFGMVLTALMCIAVGWVSDQFLEPNVEVNTGNRLESKSFKDMGGNQSSNGSFFTISKFVFINFLFLFL